MPTSNPTDSPSTSPTAVPTSFTCDFVIVRVSPNASNNLKEDVEILLEQRGSDRIWELGLSRLQNIFYQYWSLSLKVQPIIIGQASTGTHPELVKWPDKEVIVKCLSLYVCGRFFMPSYFLRYWCTNNNPDNESDNNNRSTIYVSY